MMPRFKGQNVVLACKIRHLNLEPAKHRSGVQGDDIVSVIRVHGEHGLDDLHISGTLLPVLLLVTVPPLDFPSFFGDTR